MDNPITIESILTKCSGPIISRKEAAKISGGLISEKSLANLDSSRGGPAERVRIGRRVGYVAASFAEWLANRVEARGQNQ